MQSPASSTVSARRVFVVDDHPVFRGGVIRLLEQMGGLTVCGEADSGHEALKGIRSMSPDFVIMDLSLPDCSGLEVVQELHASSPEMPILIVSMHDEEVYAERALKAGARGYVMKQEAGNRIEEAINKVLNGQIYLSERAMTVALSSVSTCRSSMTKLTDKELEVLRLIGQGLTAPQAASKLNISVKTVNTHRAHLREKLCMKTNTELVRYAVRWLEQPA